MDELIRYMLVSKDNHLDHYSVPPRYLIADPRDSSTFSRAKLTVHRRRHRRRRRRCRCRHCL